MDKVELRALTQEAVLHFTSMKRETIAERWRRGERLSANGMWYVPEGENLVTGVDIPPAILDAIQPAIEEYDPVVELAIIATDYANEPNLRRQANANAAEFLRPKLKSIELIDDPRNQEILEEKNRLASSLVGILDAMARAKRESKK